MKVDLGESVPSVRSKLGLADANCTTTRRLLNVGNPVISFLLY